MAQGRIPGLSRTPGLSRPALSPIALLLGLALLAWLLSAGRMAGMDAGPGSDPGTVVFYLTTWVLMMAAMMLPSIGPMVLAFAAMEERRGTGAGRGAAPRRARLGPRRAIAAALGLAVAVAPAQVPRLTVPTSAGNGMTMDGGS